MEKESGLWKKITGAKKPGKEQCLILVLAGILLCMIALPSRSGGTKSDISNTVSDTVEKTDTGGTAVDVPDDMDSGYAAYWEGKLEEALCCVDGAGRVRVLITLRESAHRIVEKDGPEDYADTREEDAAGGSRTTGESRIEKSTIYTTDGSGRSVPYVALTAAPMVEGVVVIAQGAGESRVRRDIIAAIQVLFDIDANKITIVKMKNNQ